MSTRSAGAPLARRPLGKSEQARRVRGQAPEASVERSTLAVVIEAERGGEQRLEADGAVGGFGEGAALAVGVLGIVGRYDHVDIAAGDALDHGARGRLRSGAGAAS